MESSPHLPPLIRLLALNTEIYELRGELMSQPLTSGRIADLQDDIDRCHRASLTTCWLSEGYELDEESDEEYHFEG